MSETAPLPINHSLITPHRMPLVDGLRLVAALMVLCFHYLFCGHAGADGFSPLGFPAAAPFAEYGYLGVEWFFMISGLVIAYSSAGRTAGEFAAARVSRLVPGAWASIFFLFAVFMLFPLTMFPTGWGTLFANFTFLPQLFHAPMQSASFWSIQTELIFYVLVAILIASNLWRHTLWIVAIWLALSGANLFLHIKLLNYILLTGYGPLFSLGILLFDIRQHGLRRSTAVLIFAALILSIYSMAMTNAAFAEHYHTVISPIAQAIMICTMFGILAAATAVKLAPRWQNILYVIGGLTYPLYLIHESLGYRIFWALHETNISPGAQFALAAVIAITVALAIWALIERPMIPFMRRALQNGLARLRPIRREAR